MNVFKNIANLFSVMASKVVNNVPNYFFTIEDGELKDCKSGVIMLEVPKGVKAIWSSALMYTQDTLVTAVIPEGIDCIRANTFEDCPNLLSVKLPKSLRSIETKAFAGCRSLRKVNLPDGLKKVADDAFEDCPHVVIPERVKTMQNLAVGMASSFRHIPDKTRYIDDVLVQGGFDTPKNLFVAGFIGSPQMNFIKAKLQENAGKYAVDVLGIHVPLDEEPCAVLKQKHITSQDIIMGVRPEHTAVSFEKGPNTIRSKIQVVEMMGSELHMHLTTDSGDSIILRLPTIDLTREQRASLKSGNELYFTFPSKVIHIFDPKTEMSLLYNENEDDQ